MTRTNEEADVEVVAREMLDEEYRGGFLKPWLVVYPNGFVVEHDSEEAACEHQVAHRNAMGLKGPA